MIDYRKYKRQLGIRIRVDILSYSHIKLVIPNYVIIIGLGGLFMNTYVGDGFTVSNNKEYLNVDVIYDYLHNEAYWSKGIPLRLVKESIQNSICFGIFQGDPQNGGSKQVGFGRIISDLSTFAYLADVFVLPEFRGLGLGKSLVQTMISYPGIKEVRKILLATKDAHGLYKQYGFMNVEDKNLFMEINQKDIYSEISKNLS